MTDSTELSLRLRDGTTIVVPASLNSITTYVVLEQEAWFEKEPSFLARWLRPGMTAIDIGANLGVYSLPMARLVGPEGRVFAYEPASEPRRLLERSRSANGLTNLVVISAALSDGRRDGRLVLGASSELNSLAGGEGADNAPSEPVTITSLDLEQELRGWGSVDFVKIDAEGEEERILAGGRSFLDRHSPLVMFEIRAGGGINENLRAAFPRFGYRVYRQLGGHPILVPDEPGRPVDSYELNLFAAKPDRAAALVREDVLVEVVPQWRPDDQARRYALDELRRQPFTMAFAAGFKSDAAIDPEYLDGLAGYAAWRSEQRPLSERCAALQFACDALLGLCRRAGTLARVTTLARATWEMGRRDVGVNALRHFGDLLRRGETRVDEPFWPANPRFDALAPGTRAIEWLACAGLEQFERTFSHSSIFVDSGLNLDWLSQQTFASTEIERRRILRQARAGQRVEVPRRLCVAAEDNINAEVWRCGLVPKTWVGKAPAP
jgi:FkbM family methyltransferase